MMRETAYDSEDHIQRLLAEHPDILAGDQFHGSEPRRWVLVKREAGIGDRENGAQRWSIDHLYLDQDAIPTLVEVKRRSDSRSRREVVGQMFDYAANGPAYWSIEQLKEWFSKANIAAGSTASEALRSLVGDDIDPDAYWSRVEANLRSGRIRMVFVVDDMPPELLRIVEFLAAHLKEGTEVYAVEVRQHVGDSGQVLATSVVGKPANTSTVSRTASATQLSRDQWVAAMKLKCSPEEELVLDRLMTWMDAHATRTFVTMSQSPSFGMAVEEAGRDRYPFGLTPNKKAAIYLPWLASTLAFGGDEPRSKIGEQVSTSVVPGRFKNISSDIRVDLKDLADPSRLDAFLSILSFITDRLKASGSMAEASVG